MKLYEIYDGERGGLFDDSPIIEARNSKEAILKHLKATGRKHKIRCSAGKDVIFCAKPFYWSENKITKYKDGKNYWYEII